MIAKLHSSSSPPNRKSGDWRRFVVLVAVIALLTNSVVRTSYDAYPALEAFKEADQAESSTATTIHAGDSFNRNNTAENPDSTSTCHSLQRYSMRIAKDGSIPTPAHLWLHRQSDLIKHTLQQELDPANSDPMKINEIEKWGKWLFALSEQQRVKRALHSFVRKEALDSIHGIIQRRIENPEIERPLRILVLGGSVPAGTSCSKSPFDFLPKHDGPRVRYRCIWPSRLGYLLNKMAGTNLVQIDNVALGGTTSDMGALAIQYRLWEQDPDIILASFAANDYRADQSAAFQNMQKLVRATNEQRNCTTQLPLLVYLDEFFGWPSTSVQEQLDLHGSLTKLAEWNQFLLLSYVDVFSDYVMADVVNDTVFKGPWHPQPDPHGGRSFHITVTWLICYSFLHLAFDYCTQPPTLSAVDTNYSYSVAEVPHGPRPLLEGEAKL